MSEWALGLEVGNEGHETVSKYGTCSSRTPGGTSPLRQVFHTSSCVFFWVRLQVACYEVEQLRLWSDSFGIPKLAGVERGTGYSSGMGVRHHNLHCMVGRHRLGIERQLWLVHLRACHKWSSTCLRSPRMSIVAGPWHGTLLPSAEGGHTCRMVDRHKLDTMCRLLPVRAWLGHTDCTLLGDTLHRSTQACFSHGKHGYLGGLPHSLDKVGNRPDKCHSTTVVCFGHGTGGSYWDEAGHNHHCKEEMHSSHTSPGTFRGWHRTRRIFWLDIFDKSMRACAWRGIFRFGVVFLSHNHRSWDTHNPSARLPV